MQYRLRTLVLLTALGPPIFGVAYALCSPPGRLYWIGVFTLSALICAPFVILRLYPYFAALSQRGNDAK